MISNTEIVVATNHEFASANGSTPNLNYECPEP